MWKRILLGCAVLFFLTTACAPRRTQAQFIGYTSPQTVSRVFTMNCGDAPVVLPNFGQSVHIANYNYTIAGATVSIKVNIIGSNDNLFFFGLSPEGTAARGQVTGYGYVAVTQLSFRCFDAAGVVLGAGNGNVSIQYSGTSVYSETAGTGLETKIRKEIAIGGAANTTRSISMSTPFGSTAGLLTFNYPTGGPAASTLTVTVTDNILPTTTVVTFTLAAAAGIQVFRVPHFPVSVGAPSTVGVTPQTNLGVIYTSGGASANTYRLVYYFDPPGYTLLGGTGTAATQVQGTTVPAAALVGNPVPIAGTDSGGLVRTVRTDTGGLLVVKSSVNSTVNTSFNTTNSVPIEALNGTTTLPLAVASFGTAANGAAPGGNPTQVAGLGSGATNGFINSITACDSFVNVNVNTISTTLLITGVAARHVRICNYNFLTAAANNVALISGTGATCGTGTTGMNGGTTAATGWNFAANGGLTQGSGLGEINRTNATGDSVCIVTSAAVQLSGRISYAIY